MSGRRPRIGITGPNRGGFPAWFFTSWMVRLAGGRPIRIRPKRPHRGRLDAAILGGGADVSPSLYGEEPTETAHFREVKARLGGWQAVAGMILSPLIWLLRRLFGLRYGGLDSGRDELELGVLQQAEAERLPVLGICRGAQLINVHGGGSLHQNLADYYGESPNPWTVLPRKRIDVRPDSQLRELLGVESCFVNSLHRQAIDRLGRALTASARDEAGVIQGIERTDGLFWAGVQWHPEFLPQRRDQRRIFEELVERAREAREGEERSDDAGRAGARASDSR